MQGFEQALGGDGEREVRQQLSDGRRGRRLHPDELVFARPGLGEGHGLLAAGVVRRAHIDAELALAGRAERADDRGVDVGFHGGGEFAGIVGRDGGGIDPGHAGGDELRLDDDLADIVRPEERGDDDLGVHYGLGGRGGKLGAFLHQRLGTLGGAVPDGQFDAVLLIEQAAG